MKLPLTSTKKLPKNSWDYSEHYDDVPKIIRTTSKIMKATPHSTIEAAKKTQENTLDITLLFQKSQNYPKNHETTPHSH